MARGLSSRFIAGKSLDDALRVCKKIREEGITATLDYLGESVTSVEEAGACREMCIQALHALHDAGLEPNVSLKLTQFGMDLSLEVCEANVETLVQTASSLGGFIRIDMEGSVYTERTLELVQRVHRKYGACGTVIQAYLHRSGDDVASLIQQGIRIRLCKGAYLEPADVAFPAKADVDSNYIALGQVLLGATLKQPGYYPAIATHDERMIDGIESFAREKGIGHDAFEFQMLYGIRRDLQKRLVKDGYRMRLYVPFGEAWYPYFMRRLAERPANVLFLLRNLLLH